MLANTVAIHFVYSGFNTDYGSSEPLKTLVMLCYVMFNFKRGIRAMLGNYRPSGPWLENKKFMTIQRTKTATMQRQPKQSIEYNLRTTIEW